MTKPVFGTMKSSVFMSFIWSGMPGSSGRSTYRLDAGDNEMRLWLKMEEDDDRSGEWDLISHRPGADWRTAVHLLTSEEEIPFASELKVKGATGVVAQLFRLSLGSSEEKRVASLLQRLADDQLLFLRRKHGPVDQPGIVRAIFRSDENLQEAGVEDGLEGVFDDYGGARFSLEDIVLSGEQRVLEAEREAEEEWKRTREVEMREREALASYWDRLEAVLSEFARVTPSSGPMGMPHASAKRRAVERLVRDSLLSESVFPQGVVRVDYEFYGRQSIDVDFDALMESASRDP